ncbi:hypothetical protein [Pukyongia salina]|nr:hypothetical protein [Pukyongia salina]
MKIIFTLILFSLSMLSSQIQAQSIFDSVKQTAKMDDERRGENSDDNAQYSEDDMDKFNKWWNDKMKDTADFLNELDEPYYHCMALISLYVYHYNELEKEAEAAEDCKLKYDLKGMQALSIFGGTTIMHCTEEIYNLNNQKKADLLSGFINKFVESCDVDGTLNWTEFATKAPKTSYRIISALAGPNYCTGLYTDAYTPRDQILTELLEYHFHPGSVADRLFTLGQQMEALGCGG